jgi:hypothetical protein
MKYQERNVKLAGENRPKIKNAQLLTVELPPTFAKNDDNLIEIIGIVSRVLNERGYKK